VKVGTGDTTLMIVTQVHGDEPMGTEAALQLLREMAGNSPRAAALREELTLLVMPRTNPDGWERYQDRDFADGLDPRRNSNGEDLNRWFGPASPTTALVPETVAVEQVVATYRPDLVLDYHHQVTYETAAGDMATMSVLWATNPLVAQPLADDGKRAAAIIGAALEQQGHATVTLYPTSNTATTARNGLALEYGVPTLLVEQRGQQEAGQKSSGVLVREALLSMRAVAYALADGSVDDVDPADALDLPARGRQVDGACE
jgi:murein tripeptide amidase MpaA